jgi:8-amino-7-oxononanoate synthase
MSAIAIVGMGCRFAGAPDTPAYWRMLLEGRNAFGPVPADRWDADAFRGKSARDMDRTVAPVGGFIDDVQSFPALSLGIPPRRVEVMDPQQRFSLETALEAIEDAGYRREDLPKRTGVFIGITGHEYRILQAGRVMAIMMASGQLGEAPEDPTALAEAVNRVVPPRAFSAPGVLGNMCAAIVAQELDLNGPAYTTDAACASALVALADAVSQLRSGAIDAAIAGGAYLQLSPEHYIAFSRIGAMSLAGACRPFDAEADGFVQGDGVGMVLLKRLEDAERDGDRIYAVLHGVAINNDGRGDGPMAPVKEGQVDVIRTAWNDAGIDPARASHVEAHGTGTSVGDACEAAGLHEVFADAGEVWLGSSKANIGHTMSAAGIAGFIKAVLSVHHGVIPPMGGFASAREDLGLGRLLHVPTAPETWDDDDKLVGISSFGFGGTNGHAVVGAWKRPTRAEAAAVDVPELVALSAGTEAQLRQVAAETAIALREDARITVAEVARSWTRRRKQPARAGIVAATRDALLTALDALAAGTEPPRGTHVGIDEDAPNIAFLYPGQGAQRTGMLGDIAGRFPIVGEFLHAAEGAMADTLDMPLSWLLYPGLRPEPVDADEASRQITATEHCQPVMHAAGVALTALLSQVGIQPTVVTGHSLGEFTAAAVAGVLSHMDAAQLVARRGAAMAALPGDHGTMAAILADADTTEGLLADGAVLANLNHPRQTVVSGTEAGVAATVAAAEAADIGAKPLAVSHAFHSPLVAGLDGDALLDGLSFSDPEVPVASAISGQLYADAADAKQIFRKHAVSAVRFTDALDACREAGADLFLQVGAGGPLASFARGTLAGGHRGVVTLASREDEDRGFSVLDTLAFLWTQGVDLELTGICTSKTPALLPPSAPARQPYWSVKGKRTRTLKLKGARPAPKPAPEPVPEPAPVIEAPAESDVDTILEGVLTVVAKVSAYPRNAVKTSMKLIDDLGFDSLMVGDLATKLAEAFPEIGAVPQELLMDGPTVGDLVDFVRDGGATDPDEDDNASLAAWRWGWSPVALPELPTTAIRGPVRVTGTVPADADALAAALQAHGLECTVASPDALSGAGTVVWADLGDAPDLGHLYQGLRDWPDHAGSLLASLSGTAAPDVVIVSTASTPWSAGLAGAARALAREWPDARVKHLTGPLDAVAAALPAELTSADRTVDVRYDGGRQLPTLVQTDVTVAEPPSAGDTVVVSGGTRGIGLALGLRLAALGADVVLLGRREPDEADLAAISAFPNVRVVLSDVTDREALRAALGGVTATHLVHAAGVLADGALDEVAAETGARARRVKVEGWLALVHLLQPKVALGIGSWAGAFGNRHQTHYAAANALLAGLAEHAPSGTRAVVACYGPWSDSAMAASIPAPVQAAMRADGVDFVGTDAGLDALTADLTRGAGVYVLGRRVPSTTRTLCVDLPLSVEVAPYLTDHAIDGVPVLPLAAATDWMAAVADRPDAVLDRVTLYRGVTVTEPVALRVVARGDRTELRADGALAYTATLSRGRPVEVPAPAQGGDAPSLSLDAFYRDVAFHGPKLRGLDAVDGIGTGFIRGRLHGGKPSDWRTDADRASFAVDPLALDSAMQLAGVAAAVRFGKFGTPVSIGAVHRLGALTPGVSHTVEAWFSEEATDRLTTTLVIRDADGAPVLVAADVVAELRELSEETTPAWTPRPEDTDLDAWPEVADLKLRLEGVNALGLQNPYFHVHEGTAKNTTVVEGRELVNYSSYNYIGLSGHPDVLAEVHEAVDRYGTSVSASRVASGERPFHGDLEALLAKCQRAEDSLVFTAGHATNVTTIGHLMGPEDLILHDEYIHDSALQGIKLSGAARRNFRHEDPAHLEEQLERLRPHYRRCLIVVEGVYSMDGDICQLPAYIAIKKRHGCLLMVDEAHSFGIVGETGCGVAEHYDIGPDDVDIWMGTLSKSLASCGGWISGSKTLITYLRYTAPGFVYSAGLTAANGVAALAALRKMLDDPSRVLELQDNAKFFHGELVARGMDTGPALGGSGVIPVITGNSMHALVLSERLLAKGINVQPIVYPAVPDDASRLRFFLSSTHTREQLAWTAETVATTLATIREELPLP